MAWVHVHNRHLVLLVNMRNITLLKTVNHVELTALAFLQAMVHTGHQEHLVLQFQCLHVQMVNTRKLLTAMVAQLVTLVYQVAVVVEVQLVCARLIQTQPVVQECILLRLRNK